MNQLFKVSALMTLALGLSLTGCSSDDESTSSAATGGSPASTGGSSSGGSSSGGTAGMGGMPVVEKNILETAKAAGSFKTLLAAVDAAGLTATLNGPGPFTVFAPTDAAFEALPAGTLDTLLKPENKATLAGILSYHVVAGEVLAADVVKLSEATTVNGAKVSIAVVDGKVILTDGVGGKSEVVTTDITASNGVIHVLSAVLLPPAG